MVKIDTVFVTGATGYIGRNVARAFRRTGARVFGLTRDAAKVAGLEAEEITPVIGTLQDPTAWRATAAGADVLVHAAVDYTADTMALDHSATSALIETAARNATVIYTSGVWLHGPTGGKLVDESTPLAPPEMVARRQDTELLVLGASGRRGIVIRPSIVYGRQGGLTAQLFQDKPVVGDGSNHWPLVHVDDLAEAYVLAAQRARGGSVYLVADGSRFTVRELVTAARQAAGLSGPAKWLPVAQARTTLGGLADALAFDQQVNAARIRGELDWRPLRPSFVADAAIYAVAARSSS